MNAHTKLISLPHNLQAEQALIGIALFDNEAVHLVSGIVKAIQFYEPFHQRLWGAIENAVARGRLADVKTIIALFAEDVAFEDLGGFKYLADMIDRAPMTSNAPEYARAIAEMDVRRALIRVANATIDEALNTSDSPGEPDALIARAEGRLIEVAHATSSRDAWKTSTYLSQVIVDKIEGRRKRSYIRSGFGVIDRRLHGWRTGRVIVAAGRPGMGKTAFGIEALRRVAKQGLGAAMYSLEIDEEEFALRLACGEMFEPGDGGPVYFDAQGESVHPDDAVMLRKGADMIRDLNIHFDDRSGLRPRQIVPSAKRLVREWERKGIKPGMILIDHLHLVKPDVERNNRAVEIGDVIGALRELAKDTDVTVMALCQLNREVESRGNKDKRPDLADLKGSGNIEEDANTVIFLYRPEYYLQEPEDKSDDAAMMDYMDKKLKYANKIEFLIRKNRGGVGRCEISANISLPHNAMWEDNQ